MKEAHQKDVVKKTIASNIKRARINSGMTQAEAAEKLGITAQAISNFERGINGIENSLLLQMCEIYHTSIGKIFSEEKEVTIMDTRIKESDRTQCPECGREVSVKWNFCPKCGTAITKKTPSERGSR